MQQTHHRLPAPAIQMIAPVAKAVTGAQVITTAHRSVVMFHQVDVALSGPIAVTAGAYRVAIN